MANYSLVINSQFKPFSYSELLAPVAASTEAHQKVEETYDNLSTQAETLRQRALSEPDAKWSKQYLEYADNLQQQAEDLASNGLSIGVRRNLSQAKRDYGKVVDPVNKAIARQSEIYKFQQARDKSGDRMEYGEMPSIDALIQNPNLDRVGYSGQAVENSAMQMTAAAASRVHSDSFDKLASNPYYMQHRTTTGFDSEAINKFMQDASSIPELQKIVPMVISQFSNFEGLNDTQKEKMISEIMNGIFKGAAYKETNDYQQNAPAMATLQADLSDRNAARAFARGLANQKELSTIKAAIDAAGAVRHFSVLDTNGDMSKYNSLKSSLTSGRQDGKLTTAYFGKTYHNPLLIRNEAVAAEKVAINKIKQQYNLKIAQEKRKAVYEPGNYGPATTKAERLTIARDMAIVKARNSAQSTVMQKYGVTKILTADEAKLLSNLGYTTESTLSDFNSYDTKVNAKAKEYAYSSVNLADMSVASTNISNELQYRDDNDTFKNTLWEFNSNGTKGKAVKSVSDIPLDKGITDIYYSRQISDKVLIQVGTTRYVADPSIISTEASNLIKTSHAILAMTDVDLKAFAALDPTLKNMSAGQIRDYVYESTTSQLRSILNGYNKARSKTDSKE